MMKNLLALAAAALLLIAGVGWYLDWFKIQTTPSEGGKQQVTIDVNSPKINADLSKGRENLKKILNDGDKNNVQTNSQTDPKTNPVNGSSQNTSGTFEQSEDGFFVLPPPIPAPQTAPAAVKPVPFPGLPK
jgi:hypothetical protein